MITPVYMKKDRTEESIIYYHVQAPAEAQDFYIGINLLEKTLTFFLTRFAKPITVLDFSGKDIEFSKIPGIDSNVANFVTAKVYSAFLKNEFPEEMNYNFH